MYIETYLGGRDFVPEALLFSYIFSGHDGLAPALLCSAKIKISKLVGPQIDFVYLQ